MHSARKPGLPLSRLTPNHSANKAMGCEEEDGTDHGDDRNEDHNCCHLVVVFLF